MVKKCLMYWPTLRYHTLDELLFIITTIGSSITLTHTVGWRNTRKSKRESIKPNWTHNNKQGHHHQTTNVIVELNIMWLEIAFLLLISFDVVCDGIINKENYIVSIWFHWLLCVILLSISIRPIIYSTVFMFSLLLFDDDTINKLPASLVNPTQIG